MTDLFNPRPFTSQFADVKITTANKMNILDGMVYLGQFHALEAMIIKNASSPYKTVDELIGDMQILMMAAHDEMKNRKMIHNSVTKIDHLIEAKQQLDKKLGEANEILN